jgi:phage FluMu gp28-like protein
LTGGANQGSVDSPSATLHIPEGPPHGAPALRVVEAYRWRGLSHAEQYDRLLDLIRDVWNPGTVCVDATGIGAGLASFLMRALPERIEPVVFTAAEKSRLGFGLLAAAETGRLKVCRDQDRDPNIRDLWRQLAATRYKLGATEEMSFSVPSSEGHDDFVISLALAVRAATAVNPPAYGGIVRSRPTADDLSAW